jgi:DNA-binding NtrC family response regulator
VVQAPGQGAPLPGVLVVFSRDRPRYHPVVLRPGEPMVLGRDDLGGLRLDDDRVSTHHAEVRWEAGGFGLRDLGSRNGTSLDGAPLERPATGKPRGLVRIGQTLVLLLADLRRFTTGEVRVEDGTVVGPTLQATKDEVAAIRREGGDVLLQGEAGAGKELLAKWYHQAAKSKGPLVVFNCANFQTGLADARLFGTVKGAFPEAKDTEGLFLQADGGVLFLDEVAELEPQVQAKLLRAVETGEVQRVGESAVRRVAVKLVCASHQRLRDRVAAGLFRHDLMTRLNKFEVRLPPLRERLEEVPWLVELALQGRGQPAHASLVEAALLRPWPGNVRELMGAVVAAALRAQGGPVKAEHLDAEAGQAPQADAPAEVTEQMIKDALAQCADNVTQAAKKLGLQRTQLNRLRKKFGLMTAKDED